MNTKRITVNSASKTDLHLAIFGFIVAALITLTGFVIATHIQSMGNNILFVICVVSSCIIFYLSKEHLENFSNNVSFDIFMCELKDACFDYLLEFDTPYMIADINKTHVLFVREYDYDHFCLWKRTKYDGLPDLWKSTKERFKLQINSNLENNYIMEGEEMNRKYFKGTNGIIYSEQDLIDSLYIIHGKKITSIEDHLDKFIGIEGPIEPTVEDFIESNQLFLAVRFLYWERREKNKSYTITDSKREVEEMVMKRFDK